MNDPQTQQLDLDFQKRLLEDKRIALLARENDIRKQALEQLSPEQTGEISGARLHPADLASDTQEIETLETLSERNIQSLRDIDDALERIDNGTYGNCLSCGEPIAIRRLQVMPETSLCQLCEGRFESMATNQPRLS